MKRTALLLLVPALALSACVGWMPKRRSSPEIGASPTGDRGMPTAPAVTGAAGIGITSKPVYGKREPVTIAAADNTECIVSEKKFKELAIGEKVRCNWKTP